MLQEQRTHDNSRHAARKHECKSAPGHVAAGDLRRDKNEFDRGGEHEAEPARDRRGHAEKQHQNRDGDGARTNPGKRDKQCNEESYSVLHKTSSIPIARLTLALPRRGRFDVNAALDLAAGPAARPWIIGIQWERGTWFAADRGVSAFIERQQEIGRESW